MAYHSYGRQEEGDRTVLNQWELRVIIIIIPPQMECMEIMLLVTVTITAPFHVSQRQQ